MSVNRGSIQKETCWVKKGCSIKMGALDNYLLIWLYYKKFRMPNRLSDEVWCLIGMGSFEVCIRTQQDTEWGYHEALFVISVFIQIHP
jgi:hypothetical protein